MWYRDFRERVLRMSRIRWVGVFAVAAAAMVSLGAAEKPGVLLISGFGPFPGVETNPSWEAAKGFDGQRVGQYVVRAVRLPVVYDEAADRLNTAMAQSQPSIVVAFGVAPEAVFRLETVADNLDDSRAPDTAGTTRTRRPIRHGGPGTYPTRLPVDALLTQLRAHGIPARLSESAGHYVCNNLFYHLMDSVKDTPVLAGFVHVPMIPAEPKAGRDAALEGVSRGMRMILETVASMPSEIHLIRREEP